MMVSKTIREGSNPSTLAKKYLIIRIDFLIKVLYNVYVVSNIGSLAQLVVAFDC